MTTGLDLPNLTAEHKAVGSRNTWGSVCIVFLGCLAVASTGCWAPFRSHGIPARCLPDSFRTPTRTAGAPLNYSNLTIQPPADYILGPDDILEITIPGLFEGAEVHPIRVQVMASGEIHLPMVGPVLVGSKNLLRAQEDITKAYADGFLVDPRVNVTLAEKSMTSIIVLGKVQQPGVHILPKFENDVGHALAAAGGLLEESADVIEIHRRIPQQVRKLSKLATPNRQGGHPVQLARFIDEAPGLSYWVPDDQVKPDSTAIPLDSPNTVSQIAQVPATTGQFVDWSDPTYSEPWAAPISNSTLGRPQILPSQSSLERQMIRPPPVIPAPVALASQPNRMRQLDLRPAPRSQVTAQPEQRVIEGDKEILRIPLRQLGPSQLSKDDITLQPGDVVVVPSRRHEVFYVVGRLSTTNNVRFTIGDRERELGVGFVLPREREIDVVTAVVMAGYIDPIDSPTTVTVQRADPYGNPLLIHVDLIKARYDAKETVLVQAGDIIYLNPDSSWWWRRTFDRIVPDLILEPFRIAIGVNGNRN